MASTKVVNGVLRQRRILCVIQGNSPMDDNTNGVHRKKRRIRNIRCSCNEMLYMVFDSGLDSWRVVSFVEQHNHDMVSSRKRRYLQVNRVMAPLTKAQFQSLSTSNIGPSDQYSMAINEANG